MKGNFARSTLLVLFTAVVCMSTASASQGQGLGCSYALAAGKYANSMSGTLVGVGPYAAVEVLNADAAGNLSGKQTSSLNGSIVRATLTGTYTVDADCTGTVSFSRFDDYNNLLSTGTLDLVWDDNMREVRFLITSIVLPNGISVPVAVKGEGRKLSSSSGNQQ